jgi:hypothetical protein
MSHQRHAPTALTPVRYPLVQWTQNNCEFHWSLEVDTREGGGERKTIAHTEREHNPFLVLYDVKQMGPVCRKIATEDSCE